jgi:hypothetical protein
MKLKCLAPEDEFVRSDILDQLQQPAEPPSPLSKKVIYLNVNVCMNACFSGLVGINKNILAIKQMPFFLHCIYLNINKTFSWSTT